MWKFRRRKKANYFDFSSNSIDDYYDQSDNEEDDDECMLGIQFEEEFKSGALLFLIIDTDLDWNGDYIIVSPSGSATVICNFEDCPPPYASLKSKAETFFRAMRQ